MVVRLPKSGTAVLTSDAVYLQENLDKNILPSIGSVYNPSGMPMPTVGKEGARYGRRQRVDGARSRWLRSAEALAGLLRISSRHRPSLDARTRAIPRRDTVPHAGQKLKLLTARTVIGFLSAS